MAMNIDDGTMRPFNLSDELKELIDELQPNEVGIFGHQAEIEKLQKIVENQEKKDGGS